MGYGYIFLQFWPTVCTISIYCKSFHHLCQLWPSIRSQGLDKVCTLHVLATNRKELCTMIRFTYKVQWIWVEHLSHTVTTYQYLTVFVSYLFFFVSFWFCAALQCVHPSCAILRGGNSNAHCSFERPHCSRATYSLAGHGKHIFGHRECYRCQGCVGGNIQQGQDSPIGPYNISHGIAYSMDNLQSC